MFAHGGKLKFPILFSLLALLLGVAPFARAGENPPERVGTFTSLNGNVSELTPGAPDWEAATAQTTITAGTRIATDVNSRAEVSLGYADLRLNAETAVTVNVLDWKSVQLTIERGTASLTVHREENGEVYELDDGSGRQAVINRPGAYRIDVEENQTAVTVWKGKAEIVSNNESVALGGDERATFFNAGGHNVSRNPSADAFDEWAAARDERERHSVSAEYVSAGIPGYTELDSCGRWATTVTYGPVWYPTVGVGWQPYFNGYWASTPWGPTWVSYDPFWAPYHYGRWIFIGSSWGWVPGPYVVNPFWEPGLVAWIGGPNYWFGFSFGPGIGWFPLGPGERYVRFGEPRFRRRSPRFYRNSSFAVAVRRGVFGGRPSAGRREFPQRVPAGLVARFRAPESSPREWTQRNARNSRVPFGERRAVRGESRPSFSPSPRSRQFPTARREYRGNPEEYRGNPYTRSTGIRPSNRTQSPIFQRRGTMGRYGQAPVPSAPRQWHRYTMPPSRGAGRSWGQPSGGRGSRGGVPQRSSPARGNGGGHGRGRR
jgi:Family of unknown function (DUF6600)/FecR protein